MSFDKLCLMASCFLFLATIWSSSAHADDPKARANAQQLMNDGNFREAYELYRTLCLDPTTDGTAVAQDLRMAHVCLIRLGENSSIDELVDATAEVHRGSWRLLEAASEIYRNSEHYGFMIEGEFVRGWNRQEGRPISSFIRDRARGLQLLELARQIVDQDNDKAAVAQFYMNFANALMADRQYGQAWQLQELTDLATLPDYSEGHYYDPGTRGAPVDADGNVVTYAEPASWEAAKNDGERWRWCLAQASENSPALASSARMNIAFFAMHQFDVQTMQQFSWFRASSSDDSDRPRTFDIDTLSDEETIARLANGIKRFNLPAEYNHIKIYREIADLQNDPQAQPALDQLARIYENRRQYVKAATIWREAIERFGPGGPGEWRKRQLEQIVGNWGAVEPVATAPAGTQPQISFKFRNATRVTFTATPLDLEKLLNEIKTYLKSNPREFDWNHATLDNIGYRLINEGLDNFRKEGTLEWAQDLEPRENHFDKRVMIQAPEMPAGVYLIESKLDQGNSSRFVMWVADSVIVRKQIDKGILYFAADAVTGTPLARANVEFFGYQVEHVERGNRFRILTSNFALRADENGIVIPEARELDPNYQWMTIVRDNEGRLAYLGFQSVWTSERYEEQYNSVKTLVITDRPIYRPGQALQYKVWVGQTQYDQDGPSPFKDQTVPITIHDPEGNEVHSASLKADEYGGVAGTFEIPESAKLGQYYVSVGLGNEFGGNTFRVEEYKKPEFEVTVEAPSEPVMLGEKVPVTIRARYYFGAPVVEGTVKYKVMRTEHTQQWYPYAPWDWCFGPGYWWFCYDYDWYPGYRSWAGCSRPAPWWIWMPPGPPPEIVAEDEVKIGPDGTIVIEVDSAVAAALMSDTDHKYSVTAEVVDASRRTIVGSGEVIAARKPFQVFTWVDRGYYRVGQEASAQIQVQTADGKPVQGRGEWILNKIAYGEDRQPIETPVASWPLETDESGQAELRFDASGPGQYRLVAKVTDSAEHTIEGGYIFTIVGEGFTGRDFRFNALELIPDRREYAPGEQVSLQINTDQQDSTVLFFLRPSNGVCLPPKVIRLDGRSTVEVFEVLKRDMPNMFVEAVTVANGAVFTESRELFVPPEERVLNIDVVPTAQEYKPGEPASVTLQMTDHTGENFQGSMVVAIYDKSVEAIAGGTNTPDIREFFWKWRRRHEPSTQSSLDRWTGLLYRPNELQPNPIGVFGATVADDFAEMDKMSVATAASGPGGGMGGGFGGGGGRPMMMARGGGPMAPMAAMAEEGMMMDAAPMGNAMGAGEAPMVEPAVRSNFADTALWVGRVDTDATGRAVVELNMPENLTTWKVKAWGMGNGTRVGSGEVEVITSKNLLVRLQAPRFFVERDEVVLSAIVHNYLESEKQVRVVLGLEGDTMESLSPLEVDVTIGAQGEHRVDWRVKVVREGTATIRMSALTDEESDAMEMKFPVRIHGAPRMESWASTLSPRDNASSVSFTIPEARRVADSRLEVRYSPTLAGAMIDALPYLVDYPHGCTEQTLNRWLPTVVTQKVLLEMGVDLAQVKEHQTNLNAQEIGDDRERAAQWKRFDINPVFDQAEVDFMVRDGLRKLSEMQCRDGGWGWFSGYGERSYPHTTAVVVHGLQVARNNDVALVPGLLERGIEWLKGYQAEQVRLLQNHVKNVDPKKHRADDADALVYSILVEEGIENAEMREFLYRDRVDLSVYSKALFALAMHRIGDAEKLAMLRRNIEQFLVVDNENQTAYLEMPEGNYWWYWYGDEIEANAAYLKLLSRIEPQGETAPKMVKYLLNNRKHATYWQSTRDTAYVVESFSEFLRATGEARPDMTVEVWLDGELKKSVEITPTNLFTFDNKFVLEGEAVTNGEHVLEIRRQGTGPVYFNTYVENFSLEDRILAAGLEVKVERHYYKLVPSSTQTSTAGDRGQVVEMRTEKFERVPLEDFSEVTSGDLVEVELIVESKNDYEYLLFEDPKPAGCESVEQLSGYSSNGMGAYVEYRDEKVSFYVRRLERGRHSLTYRLRAEVPGQFAALPTQASAMYAPELRGNADELRLIINDRPE